MTIDDGTATTPTRRRILDAGFRMWVDEPPEVLFSGFTVSRVAKVAGVTRATFYSYWPSTDDYLQDLLGHLASHIPDGYGQRVSTAAGMVGTAGADVVTQLLAACTREFDGLRADPALRVRLAFLSQADDPRVAEQLRNHYREIEMLKDTRYSMVMEGWGREPRPPLDAATMQAVFEMLGDALAARNLIDPEGMPEEVYGMVVLATMMMLTRRIDDGRDLPQMIDQINTWPAQGMRLRSRQRTGAATTVPTVDREAARNIVATARRLLGTMGWQELALGEIASVVGLSDEMLLRAFGSKSGVAVGIYNLNVSERFAELPLGGDPITDVRLMLRTITDELRRIPALTQSVVQVLAGTAAMPMPEVAALDDPVPAMVARIEAAQAAGQLQADLDPTLFAYSLIRVMLTENAPSVPLAELGHDPVELMLRGAGAPPRPSAA
jgi:AcrR family transcriptional regulator